MSIQRILFSRSYYWKYLALAWLLCLAIWWTSYRGLDTSYIPSASKQSLTKKELMTVFSMYHQRHPSMSHITTRSSAYDEVLSSISMFDFLKKYSFDQRCSIYFNHLSKSDPDWLIHPNEVVSYDKTAFQSFKTYQESRQKDHKKLVEEAEKFGRPAPEPLSDTQIRHDYQKLWKEVDASEQRLHDFLAHVRIFDKCYVQSQNKAIYRNDTSYVKRQQYFLSKNVDYLADPDEVVDGSIYRDKTSCSQIESKVFPWLTMEYPEFTRHNGEKAYFPGNNYRVHENKGCFLNEFKNRLNGKGIVMTFNDDHVDDAIRLIKVLRFLGNRYPIQIVYHSKLNDLSKAHIVKAARIKYDNYPTQDLWFVDASPAIEPQFIGKFNGFANKIMATLFNSFEEMVFLDADTVLLQHPDFLFKLKKYINSGTMFYKDRSTFNFRERENSVLFHKLMPSLDDGFVFNINQIKNKTLDNEFFLGFENYMESGLVVINKKKHFIQPFMMSVLNFYQPITARLYGDKELFWLSLVLAGDENYEFDDNFAAAIGEMTPETERHKDINQIKSFKSKELCSSHPSHISDTDNQTLVWFNSGFRFCGNVDKGVKFQEEFNSNRRFTKYKTVQEFETFFRSKLKILHAIIPPFDRNREKAKNLEHEPEAAWHMMNYCKNYLWCAYSSLGGYFEEDGETKSNLIEGTVIKFSDEQIKHIDEVGDVWMMETELYSSG
ncbi:hypothetical protein CA3LBN_000113 [Candidozyma haemuli]|uniref:Alpha-1,3-mannosyltransferase n=1 Tax=Candidozyma haemuli TaxID=45357 RepID=A0ABX8I230_9ASCO|nr:hypothetical protein CA3LBN_000113 [[Candida] haemuloni]